MGAQSTIDYTIVNHAFTKQADHYDADDSANPILQEWRQRVYVHVNRFLKPSSFILELNAGTGIDALHFVNKGHNVLATDLSDGMVEKIREKIESNFLHGRLSCQQCPFEQLDRIQERNFDFIFSNFGGLNCADDLSKVTRHFPSLLKPGGYVTLVIMPPASLWEWLWIFKGHGKKAFRRLNWNGVTAHVEGEYFKTWYHSVRTVKKAMGKNFKLVSSEGLGIFSPPPSKADFGEKFPLLYKLLRGVDNSVRNSYPFNRWGDHVMVTLRFIPVPYER